MLSTIIKVFLTAAFIVGMSELAKRIEFSSALLIALPLATALTAAWLYVDTGRCLAGRKLCAKCVVAAAAGLPVPDSAAFGRAPGVRLLAQLRRRRGTDWTVYYPYAYVLQRYFSVAL